MLKRITNHGLQAAQRRGITPADLRLCATAIDEGGMTFDTASACYGVLAAAWTDGKGGAEPRNRIAPNPSPQPTTIPGDAAPVASGALDADNRPLVGLTIGATYKGILIQRRPAVTAAQLAGWAQAAVTGRYVTEEVRSERSTYCATECPMARWDPDEAVLWCSVCGCGTGGEGLTRKIQDLAAYEENLPKWGCKHPNRANGDGWKR